MIPALLLAMASFSGCKEKTPIQTVCGVENPLTDLPWLKDLIDGFEKDAEAGYKNHVRIYQCTYKDGIGFLLEPCVGCPDAGYIFQNCEGVTLCSGGGFLGGYNCPELNIDFVNKILIWETNN